MVHPAYRASCTAVMGGGAGCPRGCAAIVSTSAAAVTGSVTDSRGDGAAAGGSATAEPAERRSCASAESGTSGIRDLLSKHPASTRVYLVSHALTTRPPP